eukprot:4035432-Pyramimonas_sp.AAC.1
MVMKKVVMMVMMAVMLMMLMGAMVTMEKTILPLSKSSRSRSARAPRNFSLTHGVIGPPPQGFRAGTPQTAPA